MSIFAITATNDFNNDQRTRLIVVRCEQEAANYIVSELEEDENLAHDNGLCSDYHNYQAETITTDEIDERDRVVDAYEMTPKELRQVTREIGLW